LPNIEGWGVLVKSFSCGTFTNLERGGIGKNAPKADGLGVLGLTLG
jgi:hypothetical protein